MKIQPLLVEAINTGHLEALRGAWNAICKSDDFEDHVAIMERLARLLLHDENNLLDEEFNGYWKSLERPGFWKTVKAIEFIYWMVSTVRLELEGDVAASEIVQLAPLLPSVERLGFYRVPFSTFGEILQGFSLVRCLTIRGCKLQGIEDFPPLPYLTELNLSGNHLSNLSFNGRSFPCLRDLDLSENELEQFPIGIPNLRGLLSINLARNKINGSFPLMVDCLASLNSIRMTDNALIDIGSMGALMMLEELEISGNPIKCYPDRLPRLKRLRISGSQFEGMKPAILSASELESLFIHGRSDLIFVDPELRMNYLKQLVFKGVKLNDFEFLQSLDLLEKLSMKDVGISTWPAGILSLENLQILDLSDNEITDIPDHFASTRALREIDLRSNPITEIPASMIESESIKLLNLTNCPLSDQVRKKLKKQEGKSIFL